MKWLPGYFSIACSDANENAEESNPPSTSAAASAVPDEFQFSSPLHEDDLEIVKAVYLSLACDLPTLRISGFYDFFFSTLINKYNWALIWWAAKWVAMWSLQLGSRARLSQGQRG